MAITVGTNSWVTEAEADTYFQTRLEAGNFWFSGVDKEAALITAYFQLTMSGLFSFPTGIANITDKMRYAQCEQAFFLLQHAQDIDARLGIRVQGVRRAYIVKETYVDGEPQMPISIFAIYYLDDYLAQVAFYAVNLERDEDEDVI